MTRQERTARRGKRSSIEAQQIIETAKRRAQADPARAQRHRFEGAVAVDKAERRSTGTSTPTEANSPSTVDLGPECVRLRDVEGLSWVQIGSKLGLPGSKSGAANARKLYASTGRDYRSAGTVKREPRQTSDTRERRPRPEGKTMVRARVRSGEHHLIPQDTPDTEIGLQVSGRLIKWSIDVSRLCGGEVGEGPFLDQQAYVHPDGIVVERDEQGRYPYLQFREGHPVQGQGLLPAAYRTVRLGSIYEIVG